MDDPKQAGWQVFAAAIENLPPERQASAFARLALKVASRDRRSQAAQYALRALQLAKHHPTDDPAVVRQALRWIAAKYHVHISTDPNRIAAWDAALQHHLREDLLVLEVGTGSGILAMLAARAGAQVVTCENEKIIAAVAEEVVAQNGLTHRINIVRKPVKSLRAGSDLPRPADLLMLDLFSDRLFDFSPFEAVRDARSLLRIGASVIPMRVALKAALAEFKGYDRIVPGRVRGFDVSALSFVRPSKVSVLADDPALSLRSAPETMLTVDLAGALPGRVGAVEQSLVSNGGTVNGAASWIELTLAPGITLEPRPGQTPRGFYAQPTFHPFSEPCSTAPGEALSLRLAWSGTEMSVAYAD